MDRWNPIRQGASDVLVVPRSALLPNDPASVDCLIEDALGHPEGRAAFAAWLGVSEDQLEQPEVRAAARRLLTQGHWQAIEVGRAEPLRGSALDVPVPKPEPTGPMLPRKKKEVVEALSWLSVEVLDHSGVPFAGLEITMLHADGRRDPIVLDELGRHTARGVAKTNHTNVYWPERLELSAAGKQRPGLEGFKRGADDLPVPRRPNGGSLNLAQMDRHYRIVVDAPPTSPTVSYASSLFASASALPTHAIGDLGTRAQELADRDHTARFGVFGHTDTSDDANANKQLADRRARAVFGVLTGDWDEFHAAIEGEDPSLAACQMMLRVLGCNPTAIDGEPGDQTSLALASFRRAYNADTWHNEGRARAYGDLPEGDGFDDATKQALLDAYHAELSFKLEPSRFHGPKHIGCGEFNPMEKHADSRRVTLAIYGDDAPEPAEFPCKAGDAGACQVDKGGQFTCKFYRERIHDEKVEHELTSFWDFDWMRTATGKTHLSALTHLADTNDARFVVRLVEGGRQPADEDGTGAAPAHGEVAAELAGLVRSGVAYALWDHGPDYDPLDYEHWFRRPGECEADNLWLAAYRPPVFTVENQGVWGFSEGPGVGVDRLQSHREGAGLALGMLANGRLVLVRDAESSTTAHALRLAGIRVVGKHVNGADEPGATDV